MFALQETPALFGLGPEAIAPIVAGIFALLTGVVAAFSNRRNTKIGAREQRAPDVQEIWAQQEADRRARQIMEDMWWDMRAAFKSYFRRVSSYILTMNLTEEQTKVFTLTESEKAAIGATPPEDAGPPAASR